MKRWWWLLLLASLVIAPIVIWSRRDRNFLELVDPPAGYTAVDYRRASLRPLIDLDIPFVGRVRLPKPDQLTPGHRPIKGIAGYITNGPGIWMEPPWEWRGEPLHWRGMPPGGYDTSLSSQVPCPFAFGTEPVEITAQLDKKVRVRIPGNGIPAPKVETVVRKVGDWTVKVIVGPWIGPSFALPVTVKVKGAKPGQALFAEIGQEQGYELKFLGESSSARFELIGWSTKPLNVTVKEGEIRKVELNVRRFTKEMEHRQLRLSNGGLLEEFAWEGQAFWIFKYPDLPILSVSSNGRHVFGATTKAGAREYGWDRLPNGSKISGEAYWQIRSARSSFGACLPDSALYPAPHKEI